METMIIDTFVENSLIKIPRKFNNRRVKVIIIDPERKKNREKDGTRRLNFKIDETLDDVTPFADIQDTAQYAKALREGHWQ